MKPLKYDVCCTYIVCVYYFSKYWQVHISHSPIALSVIRKSNGVSVLSVVCLHHFILVPLLGRIYLPLLFLFAIVNIADSQLIYDCHTLSGSDCSFSSSRFGCLHASLSRLLLPRAPYLTTSV